MNLRMRMYKPSAVAGAILITAGMILFARMDASTRHSDVVTGMLIAGFGMGLLMPVYTVAIQNAAAREHMGAASAVPTFFRSIGSTVGVAVFGTILLTNYQRDFAKGVPAGTPASLLADFLNPLMLAQKREQLDAVFAQTSGGLESAEDAAGQCARSSGHGIHLIFVSSAVIMGVAVVLNLMLRNVRLKHGAPKVETAPH